MREPKAEPFFHRWFRPIASRLVVEPILEHVSNWFIRIERKLNEMSAELDALTAQVSANTDVIESALSLIQGLKAALDAAGTDPAKLKALSDSLASEDQKLADAVAANTPAEPPA